MSAIKTTSELVPGSVVGGYRIESLIGSGGMGTVYLAEQETTGAKCALKVLDAARAQDVNFRTRFLRESRLVRALSHPAIGRINDQGGRAGATSLPFN